MRASDFMRRLRRLATARGWTMTERPGKGAHVVVTLNSFRTVIAMHGGDIPLGTFRAILKQLGLKPEDLED